MEGKGQLRGMSCPPETYSLCVASVSELRLQVVGAGPAGLGDGVVFLDSLGKIIWGDVFGWWGSVFLFRDRPSVPLGICAAL